MKKILWAVSLIVFAAGNVYGYSITLEPLQQNLYVYEMPMSGDYTLEARGDGYVETEGYSDHFSGQWVRFGSSQAIGTSKDYKKENIITTASIDFERWAYSTPDVFFETNHYFDSTYLFNFSSDFDDDSAATIETWAAPGGYWTQAEAKIFDEYSNLVWEYNYEEGGSWPNPFAGTSFNLMPDTDYYLDCFFYDDNLDTSGDYHNTTTFNFELAEAVPTPEPSTFLLYGIGLLGGAAFLKKDRRKNRGKK